jgi:Phage baseplate assembly protein W
MLKVIISGLARIGNTLTATVTPLLPNLTYTWQKSYTIDGTYITILSETSNRYIVRYGDKYIRCIVTDVNGNSYESNVLRVRLDYREVTDTSISNLSLIGRGLSFFQLISEISGSSNIVSDVDRINQSIYLILSTAKGEMPMIPSFGSELPKMLFTYVDLEQADLVRLEIESSLTEQEPRIRLLSVESIPNYLFNSIDSTVEYVIKNTNIRSRYLFRKESNSDLIE